MSEKFERVPMCMATANRTLDLRPSGYYANIRRKPVRSKEHERMVTLQTIANRRIQWKPDETKSMRF
jgi:transcriptional regulator NrdR family protein